MIRIALACLLLTACATTPEPLIAQTLRVDCRLPDTAPVPAWPVMWWLDGPAYAIELLGVIEQERALRAAEHGCNESLRQEGLIR